MASIQIPNLTAAISVSGAEQMEAVQGGSSVRVTIQQIADLAGSQYGLQPIPNNTILGNLSGVSALPTDYTLSQFLDYYSTTQGAVLYRGQSSWQALAPGLNGQVLRTNGSGADVSWYTVPGGGTVQSITAGTNLSVSGSANPITLAGTINTVMNPAFTTSVTTPAIYGGSSASQTLLIQSTTGVGTSDSIVFKVGNNGAITAMTIASDGTVTIPQAAIDTTSITVPLLIGGTTASSTLTLESTSGAGTSDAIIFKTGSQTERMRIRSDGGVSIGGTGANNVSFYLQKQITGATTSYGLLANGSVQNDVTASAFNIQSQSNIASGTAVSNYTHFRATEGTISGSMTNQYGFLADSDLISATVNYGFRASSTAAITAGKTAYGFYSAVNTATGGGTTYGFYAAGTAPNVMPNLNGGISASSSLTLQSTTGVGTTDSILFKVGNNGATTAMYINTSGQVGIGTTSPATLLHVSGSSTTAIGRIANTGTGATSFDGSGAGLELLAAGMNTTQKYTPAIKFGSTDTDFTTTNPKFGASIIASAAQTYSSDTTGGMNLEFWTAPANPGTGSGLVERMRIDSSGNVGIGVAPTYQLDVSGTGVVRINPTTGTNQATLFAQNTGGNFYFAKNNSAGTSYGTDAYASVLWSSGAYPMVMATNGTERMRIDSSGNVGIGVTPSGTYKFEVTGSGYFSTTLTVGTSITSPYYIANGATTGSRNQGAYAYGTLGYSDTNVLLSLQSSVNTYNELVIQNTNSGTTASTNIIVSNDLGTASTYFGEFGINSSGFTGTGSLSGASNVYLASTSSDLVIGTTTANAIRFVVNSGTTDAMAIRTDGNISIGGGGASTVSLYVQKDISGSTSYGVYSNGSFQSGVVSGYQYASQSNVASGATLTNLAHFRATEGTIAGTITNQIGFDAVSDLISATNNYGFRAQNTAAVGAGKTAYGFYSLVNTATGGGTTWGFYGAGSANNYFGGNVGIGSTSLTSTNLAIGANITGGTTSYGQSIEGTVQSGVTSVATYYNATPNTAATSFTLTNLYYFRANQGTFGAGSTVTNQYGFQVANTLTGATNNYAFYTNIAAATNSYNFYANGTANNYFAGYSFGLGGVQYSTTSTATNTATLTATQVASGFIVGTPTATASYTLPTAAALDTELSNSPTGASFELVVFTTAAFAITLLTATGWTLVGSMATGATANSFARFRARKTGAGAWTLYRVS